MELVVALIVLVAGLALEHGQPADVRIPVDRER